jgi:hypothetical protein
MKILIFTEGTIIMHKSAKGLSREEIVEQSRLEGIQREEASLQYESKYDVPVELNSVHDYLNYIPNGNAADKLTNWKSQGAVICYLSSRRVKPEVEAVKNVLKKFNFPNAGNLLFRKQGQSYEDISEDIMPDILIEDDCESIGGEIEMTYTNIDPENKKNIKHIIVKEFEGIDHLPDNINKLQSS